MDISIIKHTLEIKKLARKTSEYFILLEQKDKVKAEEKKQQLDKKYADFAHNYENSRRKYYLNYLIPVLVILLLYTLSFSKILRKFQHEKY